MSTRSTTMTSKIELKRPKFVQKEGSLQKGKPALGVRNLALRSSWRRAMQRARLANDGRLAFSRSMRTSCCTTKTKRSVLQLVCQSLFSASVAAWCMGADEEAQGLHQRQRAGGARREAQGREAVHVRNRAPDTGEARVLHSRRLGEPLSCFCSAVTVAYPSLAFCRRRRWTGG